MNEKQQKDLELTSTIVKMTKTFCDICGKELSALEQMNSYNVAITSKNRTLRTPWVRVCPEVCKDCTEKIVDFINLLKENKND